MRESNETSTTPEILLLVFLCPSALSSSLPKDVKNPSMLGSQIRAPCIVLLKFHWSFASIPAILLFTGASCLMSQESDVWCTTSMYDIQIDVFRMKLIYFIYNA